MRDDDPDINEKIKQFLPRAGTPDDEPEVTKDIIDDVSYQQIGGVHDPTTIREALHEALDGLIDKMVDKKRTIGVALIRVRLDDDMTKEPEKQIGLVLDLDLEKGFLG